MTAHSPSRRYQQCLRPKPLKMLDYGKQECMNVINNNMPMLSVRRQVEAFGKWFNNLVDEDRNNLGLYIADDAVLQWFGRTVKTKKDITGFLKYDMNCTSHHFKSVKPCEPLKLRGETVNLEKSNKSLAAMEDLALPISGVTPLNIIKSLKQTSLKSPTGKRTRSLPSSPEVERSKKSKTSNDKSTVSIKTGFNKTEVILSDKLLTVERTRVKYELRSLYKKRNVFLSDDSKKGKRSIDNATTSEKRTVSKTLNSHLDLSYLPHSYMEAACVLHFSKNRSKRGADIFKWDRQCKLQVAFSENPVCKGEYIIWTIIYTDDNKCRRNLLAEFDAVSEECENKK